MEPGSSKSEDAPEREQQREREHLEGLARERGGHPYDREEWLRELRIVQEQQRREEEYKRRYIGYTATTLEVAEDIDLPNRHEWNAALRTVFEQDKCMKIVWSWDLLYPQRVLVLFKWYPGTPKQQIYDSAVWEVLQPLLKTKPQVRHIALNTPSLFDATGPQGGIYLKEFLFIQGFDEIFQPPDPLELFGLEALQFYNVSPVAGDLPVHFAGFSQGITPTLNGERTVAMVLNWVDGYKRSQFINTKNTKGKVDYERTVVLPRRELEQAGATVDSYLCYMKGWSPISQPAKSKRCCTLM